MYKPRPCPLFFKTNRFCRFIPAFLSTALLTNHSLAQQARLEEVIVTGQKVERDLQHSIDSISVISGDELEAAGIVDFRDALRLVANINSSPSNNGNNGFSIRGISSEGVGEAGGNSLPTASLVIDGAVQSVEGVRKGARGVWDVNAFEVLRGPQITQGRNALAGLINITTKNPSQNFESSTRLVFDTQGSEQAFMVSGPLIADQLSLRIAAEKHKRQINIDYSDPNLDFLDDDRFHSLRSKLLFEPTAVEGLSVMLTWSRAHDDPAISAVTGPDYYQRDLVQAFDGIERRINDVDNWVLEAKYQLSSAITFQSLTTYTSTETEFQTPSPNYDRQEDRRDRDVAQDFRFNYDANDGNLTVVAGVFAGRYKNTADSVIRLYGPQTYLETEWVEVDGVIGEEEVSVEISPCVNIDFDANGDGRWYEFWSASFYQIDKLEQPGDPSSLHQPLWIERLPNLVPTPNSQAGDAFSSMGDWDNAGSLFVDTAGFQGLANETFTISQAAFDFDEFIATGDVMAVKGVPYSTTVTGTTGHINFQEGEPQPNIDAVLDITLTYDGRSLGLGLWPTHGQLTLLPNNDFTLLVGDINAPAGAVAFAWDFSGTYALSDNQECSQPSQTVSRVDPITGKIQEQRRKEVTSLGWATFQDFKSQARRKNYALYAEADWRFHRNFRLIWGLRYDRETLDYQFFDRLTSNLSKGDASSAVWLPKVGLMYEFSDSQSLGIVVTKGYRGGFVERPASQAGSLEDVDPEYLWDYELVYRGEWLDRRLVTNANFFYYDWDEQQVSVRDVDDPRVTQVKNAGKSQVYGAELTLTALPMQSLLLNASMGYLKTEFLEFNANGSDYAHHEFPEAPKYSASLSADYEYLNGWFFGGDMSYQSSMFGTGDLGNLAQRRVKSRTVVNLRGGYTDPYDRYRITLGLDNATNKEYLTGRDVNAGAYVGNERVLSLSTQLWFN